MQVDVQLGTHTLRLFNVHLQTTGIGEDNNLINNAKKRNYQAQELAQCLQKSPHPLIVCGDFNDTRSSYAYRTVAKGLLDAAESSIGLHATFFSLFKIDHILSSYKATSYKVLDNSISDHKLQVSKFEL